MTYISQQRHIMPGPNPGSGHQKPAPANARVKNISEQNYQ
jgi:hypothetical protein